MFLDTDRNLIHRVIGPICNYIEPSFKLAPNCPFQLPIIYEYDQVDDRYTKRNDMI